MFSIDEYRKILGDFTSSDEQIKDKLNYIKALCKAVAKAELNKYLKSLSPVKVKNEKERK